MPIVPVRVRAPRGRKFVDTYALLDTGSTATFCSEGLLRMLQVEGRAEQLVLTTLEMAKSPSTCQAVQLEVVNTDTNSVIRLDRVLSRPRLPLSLENRGTVEDASRWPHLRDIPLRSPRNVDDVELLIGVDTPEALCPLKTISGSPGEPYATLTRLGWTLTGPVRKDAKERPQSFHTCTGRPSAMGPERTDPVVGLNRVPSDEGLSEQLRRFWELESSGLYDTTRGRSIQDTKVMERWDTEMKKVDGHYQLPIPFRQPQPHLPNDEEMALRRLSSLSKKLQRDPGLHKKYTAGVQAFLDNGYAEIVPDSD